MVSMFERLHGACFRRDVLCMVAHHRSHQAERGRARGKGCEGPNGEGRRYFYRVSAHAE